LFKLGAILRWVVNATSQQFFSPRRNAVPTVKEAGWASSHAGQVLKISPHTGI
jgi:hypothetical protein